MVMEGNKYVAHEYHMYRPTRIIIDYDNDVFVLESGN